MTRSIVVLTLLWAIPGASWAQNAPSQGLPDSPMLRYLKEAGIESQLEAQHELNLSQSRKQMDAMLDQMLAQFPMLPPEFREEMEPILAELVDSIASSYTVQESLAVYVAPFDRAYPGEALEPAIRQLSSPEGRKLVSTINQAMTELHEFRRARQEAAMHDATTRLVASMQQAIERLNATQSGAAARQGVEPVVE